MSDRSNCRFARNDMCLMSTEVSFAASDSASASFDALLARLSHSRFRSRFHLGAADIELIGRKSLPVVREHAVRFLLERLAPANPVNDGRQTPWRGHPVFRAQHACACCCRGCLFKWQQIPPDRPLSAEEVERLADLLMAWISRELVRAGRDPKLIKRRMRQNRVFRPARIRPGGANELKPQIPEARKRRLPNLPFLMKSEDRPR